MNQESFKRIAGVLVAAILALLIIGGWLFVSILDRQPLSFDTPQPEPSSTATTPVDPLEDAAPALTAVPTATAATSFTATPTLILPASGPTLSPDLPADHPDYDPVETCQSCHDPHGGGGG